MSELLTIKEASDWASEHIGKEVTPSNISYLIQYGRVAKFFNNGTTKIKSKSYLIIIHHIMEVERFCGASS